MSRTLGLDVGVNSLGWAVIEEDATGHPVRLRAAGVRIFQEATEPHQAQTTTRIPKNQTRRLARGARRRYQRSRQRRRHLLQVLVNHGLLPADEGQRHQWLWDDDAHNPYRLRARGIQTSLSLWDFGRSIYHLNQRRGMNSPAT